MYLSDYVKSGYIGFWTGFFIDIPVLINRNRIFKIEFLFLSTGTGIFKNQSGFLSTGTGIPADNRNSGS